MIARPKSNVMNDFGTISGGIFGDIVKYALENNFRGVDKVLSFDSEQINARQEGSGVTALMAASGRGLDKMVAHLLTKPNIDTTLTDSFGKDALLHARPFPKIVKRIMEHRNPGMKWSAPDIRPL